MVDESIKSLCTAICVQAVSDYKKSKQGKWMLVNGFWKFCLKTKYGWIPARNIGIETPDVYLDFFQSDWFKELSGIDDTHEFIYRLNRTKGDFEYESMAKRSQMR